MCSDLGNRQPKQSDVQLLELLSFFFLRFKMKSWAVDGASGCLFIGLIYHSIFSATCFMGAFCVRKILTGKCRKVLKLPLHAHAYVGVHTPLQKCEI